jgi:hypothetical protein
METRRDDGHITVNYKPEILAYDAQPDGDEGVLRREVLYSCRIVEWPGPAMLPRWSDCLRRAGGPGMMRARSAGEA